MGSHRAILVMGVSGSGKSTIGAALAARLGGTFLDADDYHPKANLDRMAAGKPLTDAMRTPWLGACGDVVEVARKTTLTVLACSALKRIYRDQLRHAIPDLILIYPDTPRDLVAKRLSNRKGHFMPKSLLNNQFETLEVPDRNENPLTIDIRPDVQRIVETITAAIADGHPPSGA